MPNPITPQNSIPGSRLNGQCPVCGTLYDFQKLKILAERDQNVLTHVECSTCSTAILSVFSLTRGGLSARGLVTDLTAEEVAPLESGEIVTDDDIIDFHAFLEDGSPFPEFGTRPRNRKD